MDRKTSVPKIEVGQKEKATHVETDSMSTSVDDAVRRASIQEEVRQVTDLSAKEQYRKLWAAIKADKRFCIWTLYTMLLVFGWGFDNGLSGVAIAFPEFREYYGHYYAKGDQFVIPALWQSLW